MACIHAVGTDIVQIARVARLYQRWGDAFLRRAFHPREAEALALLPPTRVPTFLASRWAAKEALHKAVRSKRLLFPELEVVRLADGGPGFALHGEAAAYAAQRGLQLHLSISHERDFAVATVLATKACAAPP